LPAGAGALAHSGNVKPAAVAALPAPIRSAYLDGFSSALGTVFVVSAIASLVAFALTWFIREVPLRTTLREETPDAAAVGPEPPVGQRVPG
jgi:hypothetical protein